MFGILASSPFSLLSSPSTTALQLAVVLTTWSREMTAPGGSMSALLPAAAPTEDVAFLTHCLMAIAEDGGERPDADAMDGGRERERARTGADGQEDRSELGPAAAAAAADVNLFLPGAPRLAS